MNTPIEIRTIPVVVDKSHLVTIGEKLYTDKMAFVRELVNNAYDADTTDVRVDIQQSPAQKPLLPCKQICSRTRSKERGCESMIIDYVNYPLHL